MQSRAALLGILVFCIYEALPRAWTTLSTIKPEHSRDPAFILFFVFTIWVVANVGMRSLFLGDRVIFGMATAGLVLRLVTILISPGPITTLILETLRSICWATGAVAAAVLFVYVPRRSARK